ncbi:hypothetical protein E2C01_018590 [Portunus trituberculatus]|uniref:Uncharacterized protein n=1 Tax=Portunus trituberculatus TaxID=210409 RepID=A0A5B7DWY8_PORTR|nr:hypothetical protein [Portunus trituberculatus]
MRVLPHQHRPAAAAPAAHPVAPTFWLHTRTRWSPEARNHVSTHHGGTHHRGEVAHLQDDLPWGRPMGGLIPPMGRGGMAPGIADTAGTAADNIG